MTTGGRINLTPKDPAPRLQGTPDDTELSSARAVFGVISLRFFRSPRASHGLRRPSRRALPDSLTSRSDALEVAAPFPGGNRLVELALLGAGEVEEMLDDVGTKRLTEHHRRLELTNCLG